MDKELKDKLYKRELDNKQIRDEFFLTNKDGMTPDRSAPVNVKYILCGSKYTPYRFKKNEFNNSILVSNDYGNNYENLTNDDLDRISEEVQTYWKYTPTKSALGSGVNLTAMMNSINPVKDRIESVVKWDGIPRVETFFIDYLGVKDEPYSRQVTKNWFKGLIARVYHPGVKFEAVPILMGAQGIGKSTLVSLLIPEYFTDQVNSLDASKKDELLKIGRVAIVELAELNGLNTVANQGALKAMISARDDLYRPPYGAVLESIPRHTVFIGTTNDNQFLVDQTGNRRYFPLQCNKNNATKKIPAPDDYKNRDILQVLAEARELYFTNRDLKLPDEIVRIAMERQQSAMIIDPDIERIKDYANMQVPDGWEKSFTMQDRKSYFNHYQNTGRYSYFQDKSEFQYDPEQLHQIQAVATMEVLYTVFDIKNTRTSRGNTYSKKISLALGDNLGEWVSSTNVNVLGKNKRGYKRAK